MKKNTKLILGIVALVVVIAALLGVYLATRPETSQGAKTFTVEVVHADGGSKTFTYHTDEEFLGVVLETEGLIKGEMGPYGLTIFEVDGELAVWEENGAYWAIFVNGEYGMTGVDTTPVNDGDAFKLEYTRG
jgi:hypothetical protein